MKKSTIILGAIALVAVFLLMAGCNTYNGLVKRSQGVDGQWAEVQSQYQRRADLIPNLVSTVSGAANFEKSTLIAVTEARASVGKTTINANKAPATSEQLQEFQKNQDQLSSALSRLLVVSERYPDLKANSNFRDLQAELAGTENRINLARDRFNQAVQSYNVSVKTFPTVLFASMLGFQPKPYFQSQAGSDKAPKVDFNFNAPAAK